MAIQNLDKNIHDLLFKSMKLKKEQVVLVMYDTECALTLALKNAYAKSLEGYQAELVDFALHTEEEWKEILFKLKKNDVVVLIQSTSFRISSYRIRLNLNNNGVYCIEHVRLLYIKEDEQQTYVDALTYDQDYYELVSTFLMEKLKQCKKVTIVSTDDSELIYDTKMDQPKRNMVDFSEAKGTLLPVGEVFTEPVELNKVNGTMLVHGFPTLEHKTHIVRPFKVEVKDGCIISHEGPEEFEDLMNLLRTENEDRRVPMREMGFGMNRFISKIKPLYDISAHERQIGYHVSLGLKHNVYRKKVPKTKVQKFHIDLFVDVQKIYMDNTIVFDNGEYILTNL